MLSVWTDVEAAGVLSPEGSGVLFAYMPGASPLRAASVTMPVRMAQYSEPFGLLPIFDMNLPEGALREKLRSRFAKATGEFRDIDLLAITGRSQLGRVRYTGLGEELDSVAAFQSVDEILSERRGGGLYQHLLEKFAASSGISGVQPKIMVRDEAKLSGAAERVHIRAATHIVKFSDAREFPQLAANEFLCLEVAERAGLRVPHREISVDGEALVIERFDLAPHGGFFGFEDFCVLNGLQSNRKYRGSYETAVARRFWQFAAGPSAVAGSEELFLLIALNCGLRNGDAHLKNFGITYESVEGDARLCPVYDIVTTAVYLPEDRMALTMDGTPEWPSRAALQRFGEQRLRLTPAAARSLLDRAADAVSAGMPRLRQYGGEHPEFRDIGASMAACWTEGLRGSLA